MPSYGVPRVLSYQFLDESVRILFRPGFSTALSVSHTSGRGVGLDVVETEIERLGGQVRVASTPGLGSVFEIRLPVTFGLLEVVVLRLGKQRYVIDAVNVVAPETIERDEFRQFEHVNLLELLGQQLPEDYNRFSHRLASGSRGCRRRRVEQGRSPRRRMTSDRVLLPEAARAV